MQPISELLPHRQSNGHYGGSSQNDDTSERELLGSIFFTPERIHSPDVQRLRPVHFRLSATRAVFEAMLYLSAKKTPITRATVIKCMRELEIFDQLNADGGEAYIDRLYEYGAIPGVIEHHAREIYRNGRQRKITLGLGELYHEALTGSDPDEIMRRLVALKTANDNDAVSLVKAADVFRGPGFSAPRHNYPTGFSDLDALIGGGIKARTATILAAPTGAGKTGLAGTLVLNWLEQGVPVLWITTELDNEEQDARFAAIQFHRRGLRATPDDFLSLRILPEKGAEALNGLPLYLINLDDPETDPFALIRAHVAAIHAETGQLPIVVLDYLQVFAATDAEAVRVSVIKLARSSRTLARDTNTAVVAISSVSRAYTGKNRKTVSTDGEENPLDWLNAAAESGAIEYAAAVVAFLDTSAEVNQVGESAARLIVCKARGGSRGFVGLTFHGPSGEFTAAAGSLVAMAPAAKRAKGDAQDEAKVLELVLAPQYKPLPLTKLGKALGINAARAREAIKRLLASGKLQVRTIKLANELGRPRDTDVIVPPNWSGNHAAK